ncbi:hypothetical protein MIMGU_mgv1a017971mg [Erythranthe guttata]|uniref:Uncharacterized protein n=1 Tax=Erythranthe guttata TaxID=4155 RepID=A0A022RML2_ERYGU|nr:hypothetical protein MIMGU_mgv1a017971mg [Erythranthe guttata]
MDAKSLLLCPSLAPLLRHRAARFFSLSNHSSDTHPRSTSTVLALSRQLFPPPFAFKLLSLDAKNEEYNGSGKSLCFYSRSAHSLARVHGSCYEHENFTGPPFFAANSCFFEASCCKHEKACHYLLFQKQRP